MIGCELIRCSDYKNGKCYNKLDYVNKGTGEPMCPRNDDAIPSEEYLND